MSKIYVVAEATSTSGGPETLHQIADAFKQEGCEVFIYYIDDVNASIPSKFKKYNIEKTTYIEDSGKNILIVPESYSDFLKKYNKIRKCICWLSLDFYLSTIPKNRTLNTCKKYKIPTVLWPVMYAILYITGRLRKDVYSFDDENQILHLYNCEYVKAFLKEKGVLDKDILYICGPLRDEYFEQSVDINNKKDIILYNPKKGLDFTMKIIRECKEQNKNYMFVPIQNMNSQEIIENMKKAKLYIDFGFFPGPERIPREAVMLMCNILTSTMGSAANPYDVLIPEKYKIACDESNISLIITQMEELIENYQDHIHEYDDYRNKVIVQKELFYRNVKEFVNRYI